METIYEHESCKAEFIAEKKRMFFTFTGYANLDAAKEMYGKVIEFMKSNPTISFLNDLTNMKGTFTQMNDWLIESVGIVVDLGLKYDAMVLSEDIFTAFAANSLAKKITRLEFQIFKKMEDADKWLEERENAG